MNIKIIAMGQIKEKYHKDILKESIDKLKSGFKGNVNVEIAHIQEARLAEKPSENEIKKALDIEAELILSKIEHNDFLTCLDINGKTLKDKPLDSLINLMERRNKENIVFVVGSSFGLSDKIKKRADFLCSFGKITINHQIVPALLLDILSESL